ncbi:MULTISPECIES: hypothetical protein [Paraburkholderia]|uniref:hypothetical protein n=1 Tax=Paraburkholderia TaxID=1822464 RepID=UPI0022553427|nr:MULTISPECIES: hypothetical protein [Paraburkholderia]MCX4161245.1 hypothetical protein [Paraburkholderia megapolitana]MDN7156741.1 hypothetical protein [Paraburkholderia sp. CHISQ3]MDQ6493786.1 hypothetical protein [Paraburkholderia megapolitana]
MSIADGYGDDWIAAATHVRDFSCDAVFLIDDGRFIVSGGDLSSDERERLTEPLREFGLASPAHTHLSTGDLLGRESHLARYYEQLIAIASAHGKAQEVQTGGFPHFAVKPAFIAAGQDLTSFVWIDWIAETVEALEALAASRDLVQREVWDYLDQGWAVRIVSRGEMTYLLEWNWEDDEDKLAGYGFATDELARQAAAALERLSIIHRRLIELMGHDYWTYIRPPAETRARVTPSAFGRKVLSLIGLPRAKRRGRQEP